VLLVFLPSPGAVYNWAGQLAEPEWAPLASYVTGWANFVGNAAGDATFAFGFANTLSACLVAASGHSGGGLSTSGQVALAVGVMWLWTLLSFGRIDQLGWLNATATVTHMGAIVAIVAGLLFWAPELNSWAFVAGDYHNDSGFKAPAYVVATGITGAFYAFVGYFSWQQAPLAEETQKPG
jgi:amino acid transporter